jgi:inorganic triphosphatase YgiF
MQETEVALVIVSPEPQAVAARIAALRSLAGYALVPRDDVQIHDLYFDTPDRAFAPQRLALRLRRTGAGWLVALKGPSTPTAWGGVARLELEEPWSRQALAEIVAALDARGIDLPGRDARADGVPPHDALARLGLVVIQDRKTQRQVRNVQPAGEDAGPALAELAIDAVRYRVQTLAVWHHEVEIEAKAEAGAGALAAMVDGLMAGFGDALRVWPHSKLAIGFALEGLAARGDLAGLVGPDGGLAPAAYGAIDGWLGAGG